MDPRRVHWGSKWLAFHSRILRTKPVESMLDDANQKGMGHSRLAQVLTTMDLVSLGVGSCVGTGMYVVSGLVAKEMAGPGVIVSFIIAAVASILSGVCYAEFGVRVPKTTGSAYTYSYVTVGEFVAFFIGWNLILEYLIGTAAGASALSSMFDSLANHTISHWIVDNVGKGEQSYPDMVALVIAVIVTAVVSLGVKNSVGMNNVLNIINLAVWVFIMIAGLFFINAANWEGGKFLPQWLASYSRECPCDNQTDVLQGAATCFYAFIGFDIIATTGEEAKSPDTSIPYAITASLVICLTAYVSVSIILSLMVPSYAIDTESPLMEMFVLHGFHAAKYIVAIGSVSGLTVSLLGSLFPMPRVIYAMADDGLLFRFLSHVSSYTETPIVACVVSGFLAGILALLVSLRDLIEMMSIGTLLAYTLVSVCVLLLRYQPETDIDGFVKFLSEEGTKKKEGKLIGPRYYTMRIRLGLPSKMDRPTVATGHVVTTCVMLLFVLMLVFCSFIIFGADYVYEQSWWAIILVVLMLLLICALVFVILQQPENPKKLPYMAPCVPFVPAFAMLVNMYLMLKLSTITWIRFTVWCFVGMLIYFGYGMWNSSLEIGAREDALRQSTYQRYDVDDGFGMEDSLTVDDDYQCEEREGGDSGGGGGGQYQDWSSSDDRGQSTKQTMPDIVGNHRTYNNKPKSKGKYVQRSEALIANDELDYSTE
uniref:Solute carrier family 7 member 14a n=1 Tax=Callorhinchus milii TaxID=7868 RepID=A0A4W3HJS8_CALMI